MWWHIQRRRGGEIGEFLDGDSLRRIATLRGGECSPPAGRDARSVEFRVAVAPWFDWQRDFGVDMPF